MEGLAPGSLGGFVGGIETRDDAGYVPFGRGLLLQTAVECARVRVTA